MKLLILGKCPPIQGGVSWLTFRTCLELARRGHDVHLLTNADEVEPGFRQLFFGNDAEFASGRHQPGLHRHDLASLDGFVHIPQSPAYGSRMFGKGLEIARTVQPDVIVGWYFQPYGLVAAQVARVCEVPFGVVHAGSDLGRLAHHPDLFPAFSWMAGSAAAVFTSDHDEIRSALDRLGVTTVQRRLMRGHLPLHESFRDPVPLDLDELRQLAAGHILSYPLKKELLRQIADLNSKRFDRAAPLIGVYGKVGETKGSYDLVAALAELAARGVPFQFVALTCFGDSLERFIAPLLANTALSRCSWVFPPIAPWRVPGFLRRCDLACFLERGFGISYHWSTVPLEVLSSSVCLLCSREIAGKPLYRHLLRHEETCIVIDDPRDVTMLAARIEQAVRDADLRDRLAQRGFFLTAAMHEQLARKQLCRDPVADAIEEFASATHAAS